MAMAVSKRDRAYMRRVGLCKAELHRQGAAEHLLLSVPERLERTWQIYLSTRMSSRNELRVDDPIAFYDRARTLGLSDG